MVERIVTGLNDTITSEANPSNTYEARPTLTIRNVTNKRLFAFIRAAGIVPRAGAQTNDAVLRLYPTEDFASTTLVVRRPSGDWTASGTRWSNQPSLGTVVVNHTAVGVKEQPFDIPITSEVAAWLAGTVANRGFRIETTSTAPAGVSFHSMNATGTKAQFRPQIIMNVSFPPSAPSDIQPSGGAQVSTQDPIATWRYGGEDVAPMAAYQIQSFAAESTMSAPSDLMNERFGTFNVNGIQSADIPFDDRRTGIASSIIGSGMKMFGAQEANSAGQDQPNKIVTALSNAGQSGWTYFIGPNLNVIFYRTATFSPQWTTTQDKSLGDGKYASAMLFQHTATSVPFIFVTTHYLTDDQLTKQVAHTRVLIAWLAGLAAKYGVPIILTGDFNAKSRAAGRPMGMLNLAGHIDVRDFLGIGDVTDDVDPVTKRAYNSLAKYNTANPMKGYWIDHVMVSGGATPTSAGLYETNNASDHNIVFADIAYAASRPLVAGLGEPTSDTGWVASSIPQHQFSNITGQVGIRIRHKSSDDRESPWSDPITFGFTPRPTVTITSTETSTNDPSPTTTWTVTGGTQVSFQVIYRRVDTGEVLADSGNLPGADTQWQPSSPISIDPTVEISREVRVWDDVVRSATVGEPAYTSATAPNFVIEPGADGPIATGQSIEQDGPVNVYEWAFSSTPDGAVVERSIDNGPWVRTLLDVGAIALGGGLYRWRDATAPAEHSLRYRVASITNGSMGQFSEPVEVFRKADFIWLIDPDDPTWTLAMAGQEAADMTLPEDSSLIEVIGSDRVNIVFEGARGYQGTVSGLFVSDVPSMGGLSAQAQRDRALSIKRKPTHVWRLSIADMNIPVLLRQPTPVPRPGAEVSFGVSAEFFQQGELTWSDQ